jgi:hypothetical protein
LISCDGYHKGIRLGKNYNYTNVMKKIGAQLIYKYEDGGSQNVVLKLAKDGKETWAYVYAAANLSCCHVFLLHFNNGFKVSVNKITAFEISFHGF